MEILKKRRVLLIEDDAALSEMYEIKLHIGNYEVITARDGEIGLKFALKEKPDVILLDILMPKMDGLTMLKKLRADSWGSGVPVIILTNLNASDKMIQEVIDNHPAYYLLKTDSTPNDVVEKIRNVLHE